MVTGVRNVNPGRPVELSRTVAVGSSVTFISGDLGPAVKLGMVLKDGHVL